MAISQQRPLNEEEEDYTFPTPMSREVAPDYGKAGDTVTIRGENLASVTKCTFRVGQDSQPAQIVHHSGDNELKVRVPSGLASGNGHVALTNDGGQSNQLSFTIQA